MDIEKEEYLKKIKKSNKYQKSLSKEERKRILLDASKRWDRKKAREKELINYENKLKNINEELYLEGYYDALNSLYY